MHKFTHIAAHEDRMSKCLTVIRIMRECIQIYFVSIRVYARIQASKKSKERKRRQKMQNFANILFIINMVTIKNIRFTHSITQFNMHFSQVN